MSKGTTQAKKVAASLKKTEKTTSKKIHTNVHFFRPKTLSLPRTGVEKSRGHKLANIAKTDLFTVLKAPLTSESAMSRIESENTLTFLCDQRATKHQIKRAVLQLHGVKAEKINTLNRPDGVKKAFVRLAGDADALDVANRMGLF